jgi:hypothetical protein
MATDGPTPPPCDSEIFWDGETIAILAGSSCAIEEWVKEVASRSGERVDWHYAGGRANVLCLGKRRERNRVRKAILSMEKSDNPMILMVEEK